MKNRTVIGIICMVLAVIITFAIAPIVNKLTSDTTSVIRLSADVKQGTQITEDKIETAEVKTGSIPTGVISDKSAVIGKYASSNLYAGDYFTEGKLTGEANTADDVFASLDGTKVAVSITIDTFAAGLSGKLQNGDVISVIVTDKDTGNTSIPGALKYVKVITTTTAGGVDKDSVVKNDDGTYELPSTVTVLVSTEQAKLLAKYEDNSTMQTALVYRGNTETANKFLATQDEYLKNGGTANE
ncbi:MAG: Flp pilus assembly protein CpaB [Eubacteriales bacterium]|jgi:pilus assembly protein CpaB